MTRRLPLAELIVALAVLTMIALGVWQLQRADEKTALLDRYAAAPAMAVAAWPPRAGQDLRFRRAEGRCAPPIAWRTVAGGNREDEPGFLLIADCAGGAAPVVLGWTKDPNVRPAFAGGQVRGIVGPDRGGRQRLVLDDAPAPLSPAARPSLDSIPNNHVSYALQWFGFAVLALVIFVLARRQKVRAQ